LLQQPIAKSIFKLTNVYSVCGIAYDYNTVENTSSIYSVKPFAGEFQNENNLHLEPQYTRLKGSDSHADADKEGVRIELHGGRYPFKERKGLKQKVFIEMICDPDRTGLEGDLGDGRVPLKHGDKQKRVPHAKEDDEDSDPNADDKDRSLRFISERTEGDGKNEMGVLRLEWRTKYACEGYADGGGDDDDDDNSDKNKHWGFFTWFIIM
jgi:autophagy-related protein 27